MDHSYVTAMFPLKKGYWFEEKFLQYVVKNSLKNISKFLTMLLHNSLMAGPHVKKTKIMTVEELCDFSGDNKEIKIVKDFLYINSIINLHRPE